MPLSWVTSFIIFLFPEHIPADIQRWNNVVWTLLNQRWHDVISMLSARWIYEELAGKSLHLRGAFIEYHYENTPIQVYRKNSPPKTQNFRIKNSNILHISAQNIDCGYPLEPPRRGAQRSTHNLCLLAEIWKNNVHTCKPQFYYIKVGFNGVKIILAGFRDATTYVFCRENRNSVIIHDNIMVLQQMGEFEYFGR